MTDLAATAALLAAEHPDAPRFQGTDYLTWLYEDNPAGPAIQEGLRRKGQLIAHFAFVPQPWWSPDQEAALGVGVNAVTASGSGRAAFLALLSRCTRRWFEAGGDGGFGATNEASTGPMRSRTPIRSLGPLPVRVRPGWGQAAGVESCDVDRHWLGSAEFTAWASRLDARPRRGWAQHWSPEQLSWRLAAPTARYAVHRMPEASAVSTVTTHRGIRLAVVLKLFAEGTTAGRVTVSALVRAARHHHRAVAVVYAGINTRVDFGGVAVPRPFLPSPLHLLFFGSDGASELAGEQLEGIRQADLELECFELLDLDAF